MINMFYGGATSNSVLMNGVFVTEQLRSAVEKRAILEQIIRQYGFPKTQQS